MRFIFKSLSWLLTLALLAALGLAVMVFLDSRPLVPQDRTLSPAERAWARHWLSAARPRGLKEGERITLTLSESEANVLGSYLIDRLGQGRVAVRLEDNRSRLAASLGLPWDPKGSFINLDLTVAGNPGGSGSLPRIERVRLAGVPLPSGLVQTLADRAIGALDQARLLHSVALKPDLALVTYEWHRNALEQVGSGLMSPEERARIMRYQDLLVRFGKGQPRGQAIALPDLLAHLLFEARYAGAKVGPGATPDANPNASSGNGQSDGGGVPDPAVENRAAILALAAYVNARTVRDPADRGSQTPPGVFRIVTLRARHDLAQHFMTSAALAAQGGDALSDLLGLFKEVKDSDGGSGFSFADLAADRAGTRFAQLATGSRDGALRLQALARQGLVEDDIMPSIEGLPEGLGKSQFAAAYGDTRSPAFRALAEHIERRIDRLPIHRDAGG